MAEERAESESKDVPEPPPWATAPRPKRARHRSALEEVREADFPQALRGYDRAAVDRYVAKVTQLVEQLEATQLRQAVVQRALDEVGEQTSEILRQAHQTAEEITARSRSQAEGRLQRAEREAADIRREAEQTVSRLEGDNAELWEERERLVQDIRALAQDVLAVADDALDRLAPPRGIERAEPAGAEEERPRPEPERPVGDGGPGEKAPEQPTLRLSEPDEPPPAEPPRQG